MNRSQNNRFRILGWPLTASNREIAKQVNTLATYAGLGKSRSLDTDFSFLPSVNRTPDVIDEANKRIEKSENKLLYSLFWFWNSNSVDELAWDLLKEGSVEKAIEIWEKAIFANSKTENEQVTLLDDFEEDEYGAGISISSKNFSNIKNLSVLFLSLTGASTGRVRQDYLRKGTSLANRLFSDEHIEQYAKLIAGDRYVYEPAKALQFYISNVIDSLKQYFPTARLIQTFSAYPIEAKHYINTRFFARPIPDPA